MQDTTAKLIEELLRTYQKLSGAAVAPSWAWNFAPSIPFIGHQYQAEKGLLIYASAENFSRFNQQAPPNCFSTDSVWNRYRAQRDDDKSSSYFPTVGIAPMTNGGLLTAGRFIASSLGLPVDDVPSAFLETICASNIGKFAIRHETNQDYISDERKVVESVPFLVAELAILKPKAVMLPAAIWRSPMLRAVLRGALPWCQYISIPQFNATVLNCKLNEFDDAGKSLESVHRGGVVSQWVSKLRAVKQQNAWRYLAFLQNALEFGSDASDLRG